MPLRATVEPSMPPPAPAGSSDEFTSTFTEPGTLGLKLVENRRGLAEVQALNPGTQAERHPELHPGMVVRRVSGASVGKNFSQYAYMYVDPDPPMA